jgi:hypothetical protein
MMRWFRQRPDEPAPGQPEFNRLNPALYHVTHRSAVESIRSHGVLPASALADGSGNDALVLDNRARWTSIPGPLGSPAWLRWQNMPDGPIATRLRPEISPVAWRLFINNMVFLFATEAQAESLRTSSRDADRDQVILRFSTDELLVAGCALLTCRWNNGYLDRTPPNRRRLRSYDDYLPISLWRKGEPLGEITAWGGIPAGTGFKVLPR